MGQTASSASGPTNPSTPGIAPMMAGANPAATTVMPAMPAPAVAREHHPMSKKTKVTLIIVGVVIAVLAVLGGVYAILARTVFTPDHPVQTYVQAIADGDFDKASQFVNPGISKAQSRLLTNTAGKGVPSSLKRNTSFIRNPRVQSISDERNGEKRATVSYTLDGVRQTATLRLVRDGNQALIFPQWRVATPLIRQIAVGSDSGSSTYVINGINLTSRNAAKASDSGMNFYTYLGKYSVAIPASKYLTSTPTTVTAGDSTTVKVKFSSTLENEITHQLHTKLDACVAQPSARPKNCDFGLDVYTGSGDSITTVQHQKWSVDSYPTVSNLQFGNSDDDNDDGDDGTPSLGSFDYDDGQATFSYDVKWNDGTDYDSGTQTDSEDIQGSGTFTITGDTVNIKLESGSDYGGGA